MLAIFALFLIEGLVAGFLIGYLLGWMKDRDI